MIISLTTKNYKRLGNKSNTRVEEYTRKNYPSHFGSQSRRKFTVRMVSLCWYVLTAMLIVSVFAHPTENDGSSLEELIHLQNEHGNLLNKITQDIISREQFDNLRDDDGEEDEEPSYDS